MKWKYHLFSVPVQVSIIFNSIILKENKTKKPNKKQQKYDKAGFISSHIFAYAASEPTKAVLQTQFHLFRIG